MEIKSISTSENFGLSGLRKSITTSPNYSSALILNNLVKAYNITKSLNDNSTNIVNFALSIDDESGNLKLNYGLKNISPSSPQYLESILLLGKGIVQTDTFLEVSESIENLFNFTIYDIYNGDNISNCYLLGAVYFTYDNESPDLEFVLAKPNEGDDIVILHKDTNIEEIKNILLFSPYLNFDSQSENSILIYKFIIDVESFQNDRQFDRYFFNLYDLRMPEGLFGLTEENIYSNMIINLISGMNGIENAINVELLIVKGIINSWINLESWEPSFQGYWQVSENPMPNELKEFINSQFGIII